MNCFISGGPKNSSYFHEVKGKASPGHNESDCLIKRCTATRKVGNGSQRNELGNNKKKQGCVAQLEMHEDQEFIDAALYICGFLFPSSTQ